MAGLAAGWSRSRMSPWLTSVRVESRITLCACFVSNYRGAFHNQTDSLYSTARTHAPAIKDIRDADDGGVDASLPDLHHLIGDTDGLRGTRMQASWFN